MTQNKLVLGVFFFCMGGVRLGEILAMALMNASKAFPDNARFLTPVDASQRYSALLTR